MWGREGNVANKGHGLNKIYQDGLAGRIAKLVEHGKAVLRAEVQNSLHRISDAHQKTLRESDDYTRFAFEYIGDSQVETLPPTQKVLTNICLGSVSARFDSETFSLPHIEKFPKGGILFEYAAPSQRHVAQQMALDAAVSALSSTTIEKIHIRSVSYKDFGECFAALSVLPNTSNARVVTDDSKFNELLNEIEQRLFDTRTQTLKSNNIGPDVSSDFQKYMFVLIDVDEDVLGQLKSRLEKFIFSEVCSRSGIYFFVCCQKSMLTTVCAPQIRIDLKESTDNRTQYQVEYLEENVTTEKNLHFYSSLTQRKRLSYLSAVANRIEKVEDSCFIPPPDQWSKLQSIEGLIVPIGRINGQPFDLKIGHGTTNYNILIGGGVGSGKSVLLHNIILGLATAYPTDECELLLLDYKEGTEFKPYEKLPHARLLATSSEPEFGVRVLEFVEKEIKRRGNLFKQAGVSNISDYRRSSATIMPRWVIVIDEFQKLLADPRCSSRAEALLDSLVRTGRSFGVHFILATQSLFDVNLSIATQSNLSVRVCLRISEIDASKILSMDNLAPASFRRPGQAIFNDSNGQIGNNTEIMIPFISTDIQAQTLEHLSNLIPTASDAIRFEGQKYSEIHNLNLKNTNERMPSLSFGVTLDVQWTPHLISVNRDNLGPILFLGSNPEKQKSILSSLMYQVETQNQFDSLIVLDLDPSARAEARFSRSPRTQYLSDLESIIENLSRLLDNNRPSKSGVSVVLFLGLSKNKQLRKREIDPETFQEMDSPIKKHLIECIKRCEEHGVLPMIMIDRIASFSGVFDSASFSNQMALDEFPIRIFLDQTAELSYEGISVADVGCIVQDVHNGSFEPITLYGAIEGFGHEQG